MVGWVGGKKDSGVPKCKEAGEMAGRQGECALIRYLRHFMLYTEEMGSWGAILYQELMSHPKSGKDSPIIWNGIYI